MKNILNGVCAFITDMVFSEHNCKTRGDEIHSVFIKRYETVPLGA